MHKYMIYTNSVRETFIPSLLWNGFLVQTYMPPWFSQCFVGIGKSSWITVTIQIGKRLTARADLHGIAKAWHWSSWALGEYIQPQVNIFGTVRKHSSARWIYSARNEYISFFANIHPWVNIFRPRCIYSSLGEYIHPGLIYSPRAWIYSLGDEYIHRATKMFIPGWMRQAILPLRVPWELIAQGDWTGCMTLTEGRRPKVEHLDFGSPSFWEGHTPCSVPLSDQFPRGTQQPNRLPHSTREEYIQRLVNLFRFKWI